MNQQVESLCIWMKVDWPRLCRVHTAIPTAGSVARVFMMGMGQIHVMGAMVGLVLLTVGLFEGSINSDVFYAWWTQALVPV